MSKKDLQFIERALAHPWMFWVYFWKWPRIVRQACAEYDLLAKERDVAKEAHEQAVRANKIVRDWIHVTHRLDLTADMRAIWTAGKRLSALLLFLALTLSANAQLPPILRNQWTTNANPLALKVISTNGVHAATNVWELDFTNTATVTVGAVSNANKVVVSFTGSASGGSSSLTNALLHAGPTNGSVDALILTAGNGVTLTTSGSNRVVSIDTNVLVSTTSYYVDQVNGSDSNAGTNAGAPWQTIAQITNALGVSLNSIILNLARGSQWREQLTMGSNNIVRAFGSGPSPILNASDVATNANWIKLGGFTNVWMYTNWTVTGGGTPSYLSVAENGVQLIRSNTVAGLDLMPGTFFAIDDPPAGSSTNVIFIHPRGSTAPTNDFKIYEIAKRNYGFYCGDNNTVEDLHTTGPHFSNNGSFESKRNNLIRRCLFENGTKHNVLFGTGIIEDCVAWKQEYNQGAASLFVNFDPGTEPLSIIYRRCLAKGDSDLVAAATGFFGHNGGAGYGFVLHEDCAAEFVQGYGSSGCSTNGLSVFNRCWGRGLTLSGWSAFGGTNIFLEPSLIYTPAVPANPSFVAIGIGGTGSKNFIAGALISGVPYAVSVVIGVNDALTEVHQSFLDGAGSAILVGGGGSRSNCTFVVSNSILQGYSAVYNLATNNTITAANSNVIEFFGATVNGVTYSTWGSYLAAFPTLETGTATNDLEAVGSAYNGDFRYSTTSPAITNQAGPGWAIVRRPVTGDPRLDATISDTPTRQVGGVYLTGRFQSATNDLWNYKLNRTNDTAYQFKISGTWTNVAAGTAQFNSTGNGLIRLNKSGAGQIGEFIHAAAGTDLSRFATDSAGTTIIETLNSSPMYIFVNNLLRIFGAPLRLYGSSSALALTLSGDDGLFSDSVVITNTLYVVGDITNAALTASTILYSDATKQISSLANGAGALTNDGAGVLGWKSLSDFGGGSGIGSVYTNNVLAGGPGLTELGFTNSSTVAVVSTTNAGRVTMSFDATGTAAASGTNWMLQFNNNGSFGGTTGMLWRVSQLLVPDGGNAIPGIGFMGFTNTGIYAAAGPSRLGFDIAGFDYVVIRADRNATVLRNGGGYEWSPNNDTTSTADTRLSRNAAATVEINNGTAGSRGDLLTRTVTTTNIVLHGATASRVAVINANNNITNSAAVDTTELEYLDGVTSAIQTQIDTKQVGSANLTNLAATKAFTNVTRTVITNVGVSLYTVPTGVKYIYVECIGGGGGGGGVDGATSQSAAGGGGGSGAYCTTNIVNPEASYIVTIGTNGLGGAAGNNNGTIGGTTTFTNILTALGGSGGSGDASAAAVGFAIGGAGALETATGYIYSGGSPGQHGICMSSALAVSGGGAGSIFGGGGAPQTAAVGANATGKGAGGSGAAVITNVDRAGGNGSPGMIMIREYYQ